MTLQSAEWPTGSLQMASECHQCSFKSTAGSETVQGAGPDLGGNAPVQQTLPAARV